MEWPETPVGEARSPLTNGWFQLLSYTVLYYFVSIQSMLFLALFSADMLPGEILKFGPLEWLKMY